MPNPTQAFYTQPQPRMGPGYMPTPDLNELARRFAESRKLCVITFWVGLFCLWPLWIVTYLEYAKMGRYKEDVARMGVDVLVWQQTHGLRDFF